MRNWKEYVREQLGLSGLKREERIVEELADQLEEFYHAALERGLSEIEADAFARAQVKDWASFESDIHRAERPQRRSAAERLAQQADAGNRRGKLPALLGDLYRDLLYGARTLQRNPGFTLVAVLTLALGIGANTAIFSVVHGILLKPLPYTDPDELVRVFESSESQPTFPLSPLNFRDYRSNNQVFTDMAIYMRGDLELSGHDRPERLSGMQVSAGFFQLLGYQPKLGRGFGAEDEIFENRYVVVLSHRLWLDRFAGDPNILGKDLTLSGKTYSVVGVLPPNVQHVGGSYRSLPHGGSVDIWWPLALEVRPNLRFQHFTNGIARLRPGVSVEEAQAGMNVLAERMDSEVENYGGWRIRLVPLRDEILGNTGTLLWLLLGATALVLLIACTNVANLLLNRMASRQRELALRRALGAGRWRLLRQLLTEGLMLATLGGALGSLFAFWGVRLLVGMAPAGLPRVHMIGIEPPFFAAATGLVVLTVLLFGLAPSLQASREDLLNDLKGSDPRSSGGAYRRRMRSTLVIVEISLAIVLLTGAGLLLRSYRNLQQTEFGFDSANVLTASLTLPAARYAGVAEVVNFYRDLRARLSSLPGVAGVGFSSDLPWSGWDENSGFDIEGQPTADLEVRSARYHFVSPGYFEAIGTPLVAGRGLRVSDTLEAPLVLLINESMARRFWPESAQGRFPLGTRLDLWGELRTIVGVVGDVNDYPADAEAKPAFYFPFSQNPRRTMQVALLVDGDPLGQNETLRRAILALDPNLPVSDIRSLDQIATGSMAEPRFSALLIGLFAGVALLLSTIGTYGVVSYAVSRRTHEFGIRMALGAQNRQVLELVLRYGLWLTLAGVALGIAGTLALTRLLEGMLYGIRPTDSLTIIGVVSVQLLTAVSACLVPAWRATRVDPMVALRYE